MNTTMKARGWWVAPLLAGVLALTACGSDDDAEATPAAASEDGESTDDAAATDEAESTGGGDFCAALEAYIESDTGPDAMADAADIAELAAAAPDEIADDFQSLADLTAQLAAFDEMNATDDEIAEFEAAVADFDPVATRIEEWSAENCPDVDFG
jgi:hypothetical protein